MITMWICRGVLDCNRHWQTWRVSLQVTDKQLHLFHSYTHCYNTVRFLHTNRINHIITSTIATINAQFRRATRENTYNSVKRVLERYWHKQNQRWFEEDFGDCLTECHPWSHLCSAAESLSVSSVLLDCVSDAPCWTLLTQHNPKVSILTPPSERLFWSLHPHTHKQYKIHIQNA